MCGQNRSCKRGKHVNTSNITGQVLVKVDSLKRLANGKIKDSGNMTTLLQNF